MRANITMLVDSMSNTQLKSGRNIGKMTQRLHRHLEMTANDMFLPLQNGGFLVKNAKLGFGYLSPTCDTISAQILDTDM